MGDRTEPEARGHGRVHLFVVATLYVNDSTIPVRIRNLSRQGALIEGASLPAPGTSFALRRGQLEARGFVAWSSGSRAGVHFGSPTIVEDWLPRGPPRQRAIDKLTFEARSTGGQPADGTAPIGASEICLANVVEALAKIKAGLDGLGDLLAADPMLVATHPEIQYLDTAGQQLAAIIIALRAGRPPKKG